MFKRLFRFGKRLVGLTKTYRLTGESSQLDKKLVMSLKPTKLPTWSQLKKISALLSFTEKRLITISLLIMGGAVLWWGYSVYQTHITIVPAKGGVLSEALIGQPKFINPILAHTSDTDLDLSHLIYSGLLKYDERLALVPDLAERYSIDDEQKRYIFQLKDNLVWQDGNPLTADDIIFTIRAVQDSEWESPLLVSFKGITIDKIDNQTVAFNLPKPFAPFLTLMTTGLLPKHIWEDIPPASARLAEFNVKPVGSGPWQFHELKKDKSGNIHTYKLIPNQLYHEQKPNLEELIFKFYPDFLTAIDALNQNQVMSLSFLPTDLNSELIEPVKYNYHDLELPQYTALFFNQKQNKILKDKLVRKALAHAINKKDIITNALQGEAKLINSPILSHQAGFLSDLITYDYNAEKSAELLTEAGWTLLTEENAKHWNKDDETLSITLTTVDHPENKKVAESIKKYWETVGIITNLNIVSPNNIQVDIIKERDFDVLLYGEIIGGDPDPFPFWHSSQSEHPGLNLSQFKDSNTDELLEEARQTTDTLIRITKYQEFQRIINKELPAIFLYIPTYTYVQDKRIKGFTSKGLIVPADRFNNLAHWYIKTKKEFK